MIFEPLGNNRARLLFADGAVAIVDLSVLLREEPDGSFVADHEAIFRTARVLEGGSLGWFLDTPNEVIIPAPVLWEAIDDQRAGATVVK